ncbi:hypothetical protein DFJ74DRAFT_648476 [Hyaloraphidium curvatum]|nr:hypothetical protein DFJ74DRAFT_648476 [Hyaloraphidium curvatum]
MARSASLAGRQWRSLPGLPRTPTRARASTWPSLPLPTTTLLSPAPPLRACFRPSRSSPSPPAPPAPPLPHSPPPRRRTPSPPPTPATAPPGRAPRNSSSPPPARGTPTSSARPYGRRLCACWRCTRCTRPWGRRSPTGGGTGRRACVTTWRRSPDSCASRDRTGRTFPADSGP